ncbi:hypothetical protein C8R45DRAFT_929825 [Mycena sanguinolenta]|nr:hypothetical protein C8R45DRAFT_929825 [Mycena sanguinolenta]
MAPGHTVHRTMDVLTKSALSQDVLQFFDLEAAGSDDECEDDYATSDDFYVASHWQSSLDLLSLDPSASLACVALSIQQLRSCPYNFLDDENVQTDPANITPPNVLSDWEDERLHSLAASYKERVRHERGAQTKLATDDGSPLVSSSDISEAPLFIFDIPSHTELAFMNYVSAIPCIRSAFTRGLGTGHVYIETTDGNLVQRQLRLYRGSWRLRRVPHVLDVLESVFSLNFPRPEEVVGRFIRLDKQYAGLPRDDLVFVDSVDSFLAIPRVRYQSQPSTSTSTSSQALFNEALFIEHCGTRPYRRRNGLFIVDGDKEVYLRSGLRHFEFDLFIKADDEHMRALLTLEHTITLQPGDRVVVSAGEHQGRTGWIILVWSDRRVGTSPRCALVHDEEAYRTQALTAGSKKKGQLVVRRESVNGPVLVDTHDVYFDINVGDIVRVKRGAMVGAIGFLVALLAEGLVTFFRPLEEDVSIDIRLQDVEAFTEDWSVVLQTHQQTSIKPIRDAWLNEMYTGNSYENMEVMICGCHLRKGCFGTIKDYSFLASNRSPTVYTEFWTDDSGTLQHRWKPNAGLVSVKVDLEMGFERVIASLDCVVERLTAGESDSSSYDTETSASNCVQQEVLLIRVLSPLKAASTCLVSEAVNAANVGTKTSQAQSNGGWLTNSLFAGKHIDVKLVGLDKSQWPKFASERTRKHEGHTGYLLPFCKPVATGMFSRTGFKVQLDAWVKVVVAPADAIRPCREFSDRTSIALQKCRVLVIGPDVTGDAAHIGQYAEIQPSVGDDSTNVYVWFLPGYSVIGATFDIFSLCRSCNRGEVPYAAMINQRPSLGAIKHLPPTARDWSKLFSLMDARFLFWLALQCPTYGVAVVKYVCNGRPTFMDQGAGLYMPATYPLSPMDRMAPELLQEVLEYLPLKDLMSFGHTSLCFRGWAAVNFKLRVSELFKPYHISFRAVLGCLVPLSPHLALFLQHDPDAFIPGDLDFYVPATSWDVVIAFVTTRTSDAIYKEMMSLYGNSPSITTVVWMRTHPLDTHTLNFMRCVDDNVYGPTVQFHSTCVVGYITASRAWFPTLDLTICHIPILNPVYNPLGSLEAKRRALVIFRKWQSCGFTLRLDYPFPHRCARHSCCPATVRTSVDEYSYALELPLGEALDSGAFGAAPNPTYDAISWTFGSEGCTQSWSGVSVRPYDSSLSRWRR